MMNTPVENTEQDSGTSMTKKGIQIIRGVPFSIVFSKERIEGCLDYVPHDGDVIIATYPKTGTTWMQYIVHQILTKGKSFPEFEDMLEKVIPFIEMSGVAAVDALTSKPRVYKHHLSYDIVKKNPKANIIYVYRRPEDTYVSYYHFMKNIIPDLDFDEFFEDFLSGNINYGSYFHHVLSYWTHREDGNILFVSYEKLHANKKEEILRIAKFLGEEHYNAIVKDEYVMNNIILNTSFEHMKKNLVLNAKLNLQNTSISSDEQKSVDQSKIKINFFRKGIVGDGKQALKDRLKRLRERVEETMKDTDIILEWLSD